MMTHFTAALLAASKARTARLCVDNKQRSALRVEPIAAAR
jgi:hypothetical protein